MMRILLVLLLLAPAAHAAPAGDVLPAVGDAVADVVQGVGEAARKAGSGVADAVGSSGGAVADFGSAVARALRSGVLAIGSGVGSASSTAVDLSSAYAVALAAATKVAIVAVARLTVAFSAVAPVASDALVQLVAAATAGLSAAVAAAFAALAAFLHAVRLPGMPEPVYRAAVLAGTSGSAGLAGYAAYRYLRHIGWIGALAGFSRIADDELLVHPLRRRILDTIKERPGIHASELARLVESGWGTITHHIQKLERARIITSRRVNNQKCFFENGGAIERHDMEVVSAVRHETAARIAAFVGAHPMTSQKHVAAALELSPALVSFHVRKLSNHGALHRVRRGKEMLLTSTEATRRALGGVAEVVTGANVPAYTQSP